jgi:hypothetical protein
MTEKPGDHVMANTSKGEELRSRLESASRNTMETSQADQARGYLESLAENEFVEELQRALESAERLSGQRWTLVITAEGVDIRASGGADERIKIPKPKSLRR